MRRRRRIECVADVVGSKQHYYSPRVYAISRTRWHNGSAGAREAPKPRSNTLSTTLASDETKKSS